MNGKKQCSFPYQNPEGSSMAKECSDEQKCEEGQRCILNAYAQLVCCTITEALLEDRSELIKKELTETSEYNLDMFCGPDYIPLLDPENNEPVQCHPFTKPCAVRQICQYTKIIRGYICCFKADSSTMSLRSVTSQVDDNFYSSEN